MAQPRRLPARSSAVMALLLGLSCTASLPPPTVVAPRPGTRLDPLLERMIDQHVAAARQSPRDPERHGTLGMVYEANELWELGWQAYDVAYSLEKSPEWSYHGAYCTYQQGEIAECSARLDTILARHPEFAPAWDLHGRILLQDDQNDAALRAFTVASKHAPNEPAPRLGIAECRRRLGNAGGAIEILEPLIQTYPDLGPAHYQLGLAYRKLGRDADALREMALALPATRPLLSDRVTRSFGQYQAGLMPSIERATALLDAGDNERASVILEAARSVHPDKVSVLNNLAVAYHRLGQLRKAEELLSRSLELEANNGRTYINRAACLLELGQFEDALASAQMARILAPEMAAANFAEGRALLALHRFTEAIEPLQNALRIDDTNGEAHLALGEAFMRLDQPSQARAPLREAARLLPNYLPVHFNRCLVLGQLREFEAAQDALSHARRLAPDHPRTKEMSSWLDRLMQ